MLGSKRHTVIGPLTDSLIVFTRWCQFAPSSNAGFAEPTRACCRTSARSVQPFLQGLWSSDLKFNRMRPGLVWQRAAMKLATAAVHSAVTGLGRLHDLRHRLDDPRPRPPTQRLTQPASRITGCTVPFVESTSLEALSYGTCQRGITPFPTLPLPVPARFYPLMGNNHHSYLPWPSQP